MAEYSSSRTKWEGVLALVGVIALLVVALLVIREAADVFVKVAVALIGVAGAIIGAVHKHGLDMAKQRQHAIYMAKQSNYQNLLSKAARFAETREGGELSEAHLSSWAFGDLSVLLATNAFQKEPDYDKLLRLLRAIRRSLQGEDVLDDDMMSYDATVLFPERKGGLAT